MRTIFWFENLKEGENSEDRIRMDLREIGWQGVDWMHLAHGTDQWRAPVVTVMNFQVPQEEFLD
jgi:hypothetical protein